MPDSSLLSPQHLRPPSLQQLLSPPPLRNQQLRVSIFDHICEMSHDDNVSVVNCEVEANRGECKATIPRFFFNPRKGVCEPFIYGGCGGNGNNFESLKECLQQCNPNSA